MLWGYIKEVAVTSWENAKGGGEVIEVIIILALFFVPSIFKEKESALPEVERSLRKIFYWKFINRDRWRVAVVLILFFILHCLVIAPYNVYKKTKKDVEAFNGQHGERIIKWRPPQLGSDTSKFVYLLGGTYRPDEIQGQPQTLDVLRLEATIPTAIQVAGYSPIGIRRVKDRVYVDVEVPTHAKPIQIIAGESGPLPDGWDWNCDSNCLEIVDEQNQAIFQEIYVTNNFVWIRGAIQQGGEVAILEPYMPPRFQPHGSFYFSDIALKTLFLYPSSKHQGNRIPQ